MKNKIQIAPSLLASDLSRLADEIRDLEGAGADVLHFDIMDGHFVPNITFGFPVLECLRPLTKLPFDAHLMIQNADRYLEEFARVGCNWLSVHVEACPHLHRTLQRIRELGMRPGIAINPGTALTALDAALPYADYVLVMSVNPGFGGQNFIPESFDRVRELRRKIGKNRIQIEIDGGIKKENIGAAVAAGAEILVIGTGLMKAKNYSTAVKELRTAGETTQ
jgi:ribulose-phosphate 3-epimerase